MSTSHHHEGSGADGRNAPEVVQRFRDQLLGLNRRTYSDGRMAPDDDGDLTYAVAADLKHKMIRIDFGKPVVWIGLPPENVEQLIQILQEKLFELRGITK